MTGPTLDSKLRNRIMRFIHTGIEVPRYYPGSWSAHKYFDADKLTAINEAIQEHNVNGVEIVNLIVQAAKDGWYTRFEPIVFALTKCLLIGSEAVKVAVYKGAMEICQTPEQLMLFNKHTRMLKTGNGQGWCKSVREWYIHKDPMELAKEIGRVRARFGRSHKTLIRKSHMKIASEDYARDAVIKYTVYGLKRAKQLIGDKPGTKEIYEFFQRVDDLKHCEDPVAAAAIATQNQFSLEHVPGHLLTSQDVWDAVLPQMSLRDILHNIQRIHNMGFITNDSTTTAILVSLLNNQDVINKSEVTPIEVFITLQNYKLKSKPVKAEKAKIVSEKEERRRLRQIFDAKTGLWEWSSTKRHPKEIKNWGIEKPPSEEIITALNKLIDQSWLVTKPTNVRYLITMDMRHHMFKGRHFCKRYVVPKKGKKATKATSASTPTAATNATPAAGGDAEPKKESKKHLQAECFYNTAVTPGHAAIILALQLLKRDKNVKLAVFTEEGIQMVTLERNFTNIEEAEFQLRKMNLGRVQLDAPMEWAAKNNQKFDVFINMIDRSTRYMELDHEARGGRGNGARFGPPPKKNLVDHCPVRALERYRNNVGPKDAKLVVMNLASHRVQTTDGTHEGILDVIGIDEYVPKLLDAFALGQFK